MAKYVRTLKYMISQGYNRDKALFALSKAFALSPDQIAELAKAK